MTKVLKINHNLTKYPITTGVKSFIINKYSKWWPGIIKLYIDPKITKDIKIN
jgi:hypothetical protein